MPNFMEGLAQGMQGLPGALAHRESLDFQQQHLQIQQAGQDRLNKIEARKELGEQLKGLDDIVQNVPQEQQAAALDMAMQHVEEVTGKKIPPAFKAGFKKDPQGYISMLVQQYQDNPEMTAQNFGEGINPQMLTGMMVAYGKDAKQKAAAAVAKNAVALPAGNQDVTQLTAKRDALNEALNDEKLNPHVRESMNIALKDVNDKLGTATDDKSQSLQVARELRLDPANPDHQRLIAREIRDRAITQAGATKGAETLATTQNSLVDKGTAQGLKISPLQTNASAAAGTGGTGLLPTEEEQATTKANIERRSKPIDQKFAEDNQLDPSMTQGQLEDMQSSQGKSNFKFDKSGKLTPQAPANPLTYRSPEERKFAEQQATDWAEQMKKSGAESRMHRDVIDNYNAIRVLKKDAYTGMGGENKTKFDQAMSMFGIDSVKLGPTQALNKFTGQMAIQAAQDLKGSFSENDIALAKSIVPSVKDSDKALDIYMDMDQLKRERKQKYAENMANYTRRCGVNGIHCENQTYDEFWNKEISKPENSLKPKLEAIVQKYGVGQPAAKGNAGSAPPPLPASAPSAPASQPSTIAIGGGMMPPVVNTPANPHAGYVTPTNEQMAGVLGASGGSVSGRNISISGSGAAEKADAIRRYKLEEFKRKREGK